MRSSFELQIIDVRALSMSGAYLYEVLILEADGAVLQLYYDGKTAELVAWTGVGAGEGRESSTEFAAEVFSRVIEGKATANEQQP